MVKDPDTIVHEGDYFTAELPDSMVFHDGLISTFDLTDENGTVVVQATVDPGPDGRGGIVTVTSPSQDAIGKTVR